MPEQFFKQLLGNRIIAIASICFVSSTLSQSAAQAVPGLASPSSVKEITRMLKSYTGSRSTNIHEIEQQLRDRPSENGEALVNILDTTDEQLKLHAAQLLQSLSSHGTDFTLTAESIKTLVCYLKASRNVQVQSALLGTLGNVGPKNDLVKKTIVDAMTTSKEVAVRRAGVEALARLAREEKPSLHAASTAALIAVMKDDDAPAVRAAAAGALGNYREHSPLAVPGLIAALEDNYLMVRSRAAQALGHYGKAATAAIPKLLETMKNETDQSIRSSCIYSLRNIDPSNDTVVKQFVELLDDPQMGNSILSYMQNVGPKGAPAVPKLIAILNDSDSPATRHRRSTAVRILGSIGPDAKEAVPTLTKLLNENDVSLRHAIEQALRSIEPATENGAQRAELNNASF